MPGNTLLIIDDEPDMLAYLECALVGIAANYVLVESAEEALRLIEASPLDAILSDIHMPGRDGLALLGAVREMKLNVPFVFLSANGDQELVAKTIRMGAFGFLEKPVDVARLRLTVAAALAAGPAAYPVLLRRI